VNAPLLDETVAADGHRYRVAWFDPPFRPALAETTQALGICFTPQRRIVLVTWNGRQWSLPGGSVEHGETLERTLAREVLEEACARVLACRYIGCQRVEELEGNAGAYYQTRFWARVELNPFTDDYEMTGRRLVEADEFLSALSWGGEATARLILERGLAIEGELASSLDAAAR
jgi:ADP-ribose pyrophosphatase YjhB (NUDIX family)